MRQGDDVVFSWTEPKEELSLRGLNRYFRVYGLPILFTGGMMALFGLPVAIVLSSLFGVGVWTAYGPNCWIVFEFIGIGFVGLLLIVASIGVIALLLPPLLYIVSQLERARVTVSESGIRTLARAHDWQSIQNVFVDTDWYGNPELRLKVKIRVCNQFSFGKHDKVQSLHYRIADEIDIPRMLQFMQARATHLQQPELGHASACPQ